MAETMKCVSEDAKYEIVAEIDFETKKIELMEYFKNGAKYMEFTDLDMTHSRTIFTGRKDSYDVVFAQSALYMELIMENDGKVHGNFLPTNSILSFERQISCERN